ncbi:hypothetical protein T484DRAFT_1796260 [Baffinella frigidus]|nr:hypothetical protein T484DRAFT_1796260 [Cryptophyta sp. CCMP2293]
MAACLMKQLFRSGFPWLLALVIVAGSESDLLERPDGALTSTNPPPLPSILLVGDVPPALPRRTLDGRVSALEARTGDVLWSLDTGGGMVSSFQNDSSFGTIVPSLSGAILMMGRESGALQKLPASAQSLVEQSPFLAGDGSVYVGTKKSDVYLVDLDTGALEQAILSPARLGRGGAPTTSPEASLPEAGPSGRAGPAVGQAIVAWL